MLDMRLGSLIVLCLALAGCSPGVDANNAANAHGNDQDRTEVAAVPKPEDDVEGRVFNYFTLADAEKLLEGKVRLIDSATVSNNAYWTFTSNFQSSDSMATASSGSLQLIFRHYQVQLAAHEAYIVSQKAASNGKAIRVLRDVGDESYYYRDKQFIFATVRNGNDLFGLRLSCNINERAEQRLYSSLREVTSR
jgi:hypothetical protein